MSFPRVSAAVLLVVLALSVGVALGPAWLGRVQVAADQGLHGAAPSGPPRAPSGTGWSAADPGRAQLAGSLDAAGLEQEDGHTAQPQTAAPSLVLGSPGLGRLQNGPSAHTRTAVQRQDPDSQPAIDPAVEDQPAQDPLGIGAEESSAILAAFDRAVTDWLSGSGDAEQLAVAALARRPVMAGLIRTDPAQALAHAVRWTTRRTLPAAVVEQLEQPVDGVGRYAVLGRSQPTAGTPAITRRATVAGTTYTAQVFGTRTRMTTQDRANLHGVALDGQIALHEQDWRPMEPAEAIARMAGVSAPCAVSGKATVAAAALAGDQVFTACSSLHLAQHLRQRPGLGADAVAGSAYSTGPKTVLFIRVDFSDRPGDPLSADDAKTLIEAKAGGFLQENSYNATSLSATVTATLRMPKTRSTYGIANGGDVTLMDDAVAAAKSVGTDPASFSFFVVAFAKTFNGWSGQAYVRWPGAWLNGNFSQGVCAHELGHNYGLWHANAWAASQYSIIGPGTNQEYGNGFDVMGAAGGDDQQFNAEHKHELDWLPEARVARVTTSGVYQLAAFDVPALDAARPAALAIAKTGDADHRTYWVECRQRFASNRSIQSGILLLFAPWDQSNGGSQLLDTTPWSALGRDDAAVVCGRTFSDRQAGIHITPLRILPLDPKVVEVAVNLGQFAGNRPPALSLAADTITAATGQTIAFTATASDSDGDDLAFSWDFGDNRFGPNAFSATASWTTPGEYVVACTASDLKGGATIRQVVVRIGTVTGKCRMTGRVHTVGGNGLSGVQVVLGGVPTQVALTDSDGAFALVNVPIGITVPITPIAAWWTFTPDSLFVVTENTIALDFTASGGPEPPDTTPPGVIPSLAPEAVTGTTISLAWLATGDDGTIGTATTYDLRFSTGPVNESTWARATIPGDPLPAPGPAGAKDRVTVTGLAPGTIYHFAIRAADDAGNQGPISAEISVATASDGIPPAVVTDLTAAGITSTSADLRWTAPGDDGSVGTAASYDLRHSFNAISEATWAAALPVGPEPVPSPAGTSQRYLLADLIPGTTYTAAIRSFDEVGNRSAVSNVVTFTTRPLTIAQAAESSGGSSGCGLGAGLAVLGLIGLARRGRQARG